MDQNNNYKGPYGDHNNNYSNNMYQNNNMYQSGNMSQQNNMYQNNNMQYNGSSPSGMLYKEDYNGYPGNGPYQNMNKSVPPKASGLSIAAFVLSLLGCTSIIGLILGIVDLTKKDERKKGFSIAAVIISSLALVGGMGVIVLSKSSSNTTSTSSSTESAVSTTDESVSSSDEETANVSASIDTNESEDDYKKSCEPIDYDDVSRNPSSYEGKNMVLAGTVVQVQENEAFLSDDVSVVLRIAEDGDHNKMWYVNYTRTDQNESRILEDDYITIYGTCNGIKSYTAVLGNEVTVPEVNAKYIANGKVDENDNVVSFDEDEIVSNLKVTELISRTDYSVYYFLEIENTSIYDLDIDASVKYYDESGNLIGTDSGSEYAIAQGYKALLIFYPDDNFSRAEYKIDVKNSSIYKPANDAISYEVSETEEKIIVTVKNISDETLDSVEGKALFYKDGAVIGYDTAYFTDSDSELKAGDDVSKELNCYSGYDSYEIYFYPKKSSY